MIPLSKINDLFVLNCQGNTVGTSHDSIWIAPRSPLTCLLPSWRCVSDDHIISGLSGLQYPPDCLLYTIFIHSLGTPNLSFCNGVHDSETTNGATAHAFPSHKGCQSKHSGID